MTFPQCDPPSAAADSSQPERGKKPYKSTKLMDGPETGMLYTPRGFPVITWMMSLPPSQPMKEVEEPPVTNHCHTHHSPHPPHTCTIKYNINMEGKAFDTHATHIYVGLCVCQVYVPFPAAIPVTKLPSSKSTFHCHLVSLNP